MASTTDYLYFVLDLLNEVSDITYKKMMGEYVLYKNNIVFGGIYDDRFLVKNTKSLKEYNLKEIVPYPGAKPMLLIDSEDSSEIKLIVEKVYFDLTNKN